MWKFRIWGGTCDEILLAVSVQSHAALCRGRGSVDGFDVLLRTFEHLTTVKKQTFNIIVGLQGFYTCIENTVARTHTLICLMSYFILLMGFP